MKKIRRIPFTKEGYEKIKKEHDDLLAKRKEAVIVLQQARELGDLSENGLYKAARANLSSIDNRINRLSMLIKLGEVNEISDKENVNVGSVVTLSDGNKVKKYTIVGEYEADPLQGKISTLSPLGNSLLDKKVGDVITVTTPSGNIVYKIIKVTNN